MTRSLSGHPLLEFGWINKSDGIQLATLMGNTEVNSFNRLSYIRDKQIGLTINLYSFHL